MYFFRTAPPNTCVTFLGLSDCFTREVSNCFLLILFKVIATLKITQSQFEVSVKYQLVYISPSNSSHTIILSKHVQLALRKVHNYADSQSHSQIDLRLIGVSGGLIAK